MAEVAATEPLPELDVAIDPDFEPQKRPRSCTWPLPRPESSAGKPESHDADIIPEEEDDEEDHVSSMAVNDNGTNVASEDQSSNSPTTEGLLSSLGQENGGSPLSAHSPPASGALTSGPGAQQTPRKSSSRRNAWGNMSYADLITKAIESTPDKRLTLSQIYDWMVRCVPYFKDKGDSNSSAGWKNSIRHNLSLHSRFIRVQNEGTGKSSWWMINPEGGKGGKAPRRRAVSMDNSNKYTKSARGRAAKKKAALQAAAAAGGEGGGADSPQGLSRWPGSPASRSSEELDAWTDFRSRTNSNASTLSGRLSPILANAELDEAPDDEPPLSPMLYAAAPAAALSPPPRVAVGNGAAAAKAPLPPAELAGAASLNDGLSDELMDELLDNITLALAPLAPPPAAGPAPPRGPAPAGFGFAAKPAPLGSPSPSPSSPSPSGPAGAANGGGFAIFGAMTAAAAAAAGGGGVSLRPAPMQTIQENKQTSFSSISRFGGQTLQDLLSADGHAHSDVMMTQSDPLMSQAGAAAIVSQNSRRGLMLRSDPMMSFGGGGGGHGGHGALHHHGNYGAGSLRGGGGGGGGLSLGGEANGPAGAKHHPHSPLGGNGSSSMQIDSSLFLNGPAGGGGGGPGGGGVGVCLGQDRFPSDLDLDMFSVGGLECDMDSIIRSELMDADGLEISFDSLISMNGVGGFPGAKHTSHSWVPG